MKPIYKMVLSVFFGILVGIGKGAVVQATEIVGLDFKMENQSSVLNIRLDQAVQPKIEQDPDRKQVRLLFENATFTSFTSRLLDTSSFPSSVVLVRPVQKEAGAQVLVQLKTWKEPKIDTSEAGGKNIKVQFQEENASQSAASETPEGFSNTSEKNREVAAKLKSVEERLKTKRFEGSPVTLQLKNAPVEDVLRLISDTSGFNIVIGPNVKGTLTLSLVSVPWDQALDVVLSTLKLGAERKASVLRVMTLDNLKNEKEALLAAKKASEASTPRVTRIFPISYSDPKKLSKLLINFLEQTSSSNSSSTKGAPSSKVLVNVRTNSIIVQDIPKNVEKVARLIKILDTQTPQVLIEAKVVEASESFSESLGGSLGVGGTGSNQFIASFSGANPVDGLVGNPGVFAAGTNVATASQGAGLIGISPTLAFLPGVGRLNAILSIGESEQLLKIVSAPKTVVLNKEQAKILQSTPVIIETTTVIDGAPLVTKNVLQANLSLTATPTVTNDENVLLDLKITRDIPKVTSTGDTAVANRSMNTKVVVRSGSTLVIGGIYTLDRQKSSSGFPLLRKIPILGWLFGSEAESTERTELFIFVTPRILTQVISG